MQLFYKRYNFILNGTTLFQLHIERLNSLLIYVFFIVFSSTIKFSNTLSLVDKEFTSVIEKEFASIKKQSLLLI